MNDKNYFLEDDPSRMIEKMEERFLGINNSIRSNGILNRWTKCYYSYYNFYYDNIASQSGMGETGGQGEFKTMAINQFRNILQHTLSLFAQNKVSFDSIPNSSDIEARNATIVGNNLLEYIYEKPKYSQEIYRMAERGLLYGTSFLLHTWDRNKNFVGMDVNYQPIFQGEFSLKSMTPFDVILEPFIDRFEDQSWICTKEKINRFDLISQYPHLKDEILKLPSIGENQYLMPYMEKDRMYVWIFKMYHKATLSLPFGRHTVFCSPEVVLEDYEKNPYCYTDPKTGIAMQGSGIPAVCFRPSEMDGSAFGHSVSFDLLPIQDMKNLITSSIATNQAAFGVQNIIVPRGTNIEISALAEGMRVLEVDLNPDLGPGGGIPSVLELLRTPAELFKYDDKLDSEFEKQSGMNGAVRGNPPAQMSSGVGVALLTTQAQSFIAPLENTYLACIQTVAENTLRMFAKWCPTEDIVAMVGKREESSVSSFRAENLASIQGVRINVGNALSKSVAGRLVMAQDMANMGQLSAAEYLEVQQTGNLKNKVENITEEEALIQWENQQLMQGIEVEAYIFDNPLTHMKNHFAVGNMLEVRKDPQKYVTFQKHMAQHQQFSVQLGVENPQLLALITGSPIPPDTPQPGVTPQIPGSEEPVEGTPPIPPEMSAGAGKNNLMNASTPGGDRQMAASGMREASKLMSKVA